MRICVYFIVWRISVKPQKPERKKATQVWVVIRPLKDHSCIKFMSQNAINSSTDCLFTFSQICHLRRDLFSLHEIRRYVDPSENVNIYKSFQMRQLRYEIRMPHAVWISLKCSSSRCRFATSRCTWQCRSKLVSQIGATSRGERDSLLTSKSSCLSPPE